MQERVELDVCLSQLPYFSYGVCQSCRTCNEHQIFSHTQDLIAAFCSVFKRNVFKYKNELFFNFDFSNKFSS